MHICHVITGLGAGGTPVMLHKLLSAFCSDVSHPHQHSVIGLIGRGVMGDRISELGIPVSALGMPPGRPSPLGWLRLVQRLRSLRPDLIQTWLYHSDLLGGLAGRWLGNIPIVWNLRHASLDHRLDSRSTRWTSRLCGRLSGRLCDAIIVNSHAGRQIHIDAGYHADKMTIIENGFDVDLFRPSTSARQQIRRELGLPMEVPLIGLVARWSPLKGQPLFLESMEQVARQHPDVQFLLCGTGMTAENSRLAWLLEGLSSRARFHLLGERHDLPKVQAALDIAVSASTSEAFSNSLGEALACGVPCVATDVGDSARLVALGGRIVPSGDAPAMARACLEILALDAGQRQSLSEAARRSIVERFALQQIARRYISLWDQVHREFVRGLRQPAVTHLLQGQRPEAAGTGMSRRAA